MRYLSGEEETQAIMHLDEAAAIAYTNSNCLRSKCGSVIVKDGKIIGKEANVTPDKKPIEKCIKDSLPADFKSEKHCCLHAEQAAILDAMEKNPGKIEGSTLYFVRVDADGNITPAGKPYCTICSKMAQYAKIAEFVLWHKEGICVYSTEEYNKLSFQFRGE